MKCKRSCDKISICNTKTGRCVKRDGKIGKEILNKKKKSGSCSSPKSLKKKECNGDSILNPKTNRCVKKDGKIGKLLRKSNSKPKSTKNARSYMKRQPCSVTKLINTYTNKEYNIKCDDDTLHPTIDVNKIQIGNTINSIYPTLLYDNKIKLNNMGRTIAYGAYGNIYEYADSHNKYTVIVKFVKARHSCDSDLKMTCVLQKIGVIKCNIIPARYIGRVKINNKDYSVIVMLRMNGTLEDISQIFTDTSLEPVYRMNLILEIMSSIMCLAELKLYYTDIKPSNILYKCINKKNMIFTLGDIGGLTKSKHSYQYTFDPEIYLKKDKTTISDIISVGICSVILFIFGFDIDLFGITKHDKKLKKKYPEIYDLIYDIFNSKKSVPLQQIYDSCKKLYRK